MRVAIVQMCAGEDPRANLEKALRFLREGVRKGAEFLALPELFLYRGRTEWDGRVRESIPGPSTSALAAFARRHRVYLLCGSILEKAPGVKSYNTSVLLRPSGRIAARYRKIHLFDAALSGGPSVRESVTLLPGGNLATGKVKGMPVGLTICYDLRFPELYRALTERGAEMFFVPSNFTRFTGRDHWKPLLRARAIENQAYVLAPDQCGVHPATGVKSHGHSMIIDPWGGVLGEADGRSEGVVLATVDRERVRRIRRELPALAHRRLR